MNIDQERILREIIRRYELDEEVYAVVADSENITSLLVKYTKLAATDLLSFYSEVLQIELFSQEDLTLYPPVEGLSFSFLLQNNILPLLVNDEVGLVTSEPCNSYVKQAVKLATGKNITLYLAMPEHISRALEKINNATTTLSGLSDEINEQSLSDALDDVDKLKDLASEAPIVRLVNLLVADAIKLNASDIHIEPFDHSLRIRYRVDGLLRSVDAPPVQSTAAIISRIKIMAKLDIAERRLPQDGRIKLSTHGHRVDLRVSTTPSMYGESVVIRILDKESLELDLNKLGFDEDNITLFRKLIQRQQGIVLVTGPTGSGKTTTLYAALSELNSSTKKIMTVEDPIEYQIDGIIQMQTKADIGLGFAETLRSIVRQDPDNIMIGEMRDQETARIAMQSALTGHFVLSTLHTNDVGSSITRLVDIGVEHYLISSTIVGVIAQRLVRRLCSSCKVAFEPSQEVISEYQLESYQQTTLKLFKPVGCEHCGQTGYSGRTVILEQLEMNDVIRAAILSGKDGSGLQQLARSQGMLTMREDGIKKALVGITSLEEILRVTQGQN